jgi:hypothetical protein
MEPATTPAPNVASYTVVVDCSSPLPAVPRCTWILPIVAFRMLLLLLLLQATAAARCCQCCLPCCARCCLPCCAPCCSPCVQQAAAALGGCVELCCLLLGFSPHTRGTCLRQRRKTKEASRSVTCAATCLGYLSMCSRFWSHAKSLALLGGTLGEMWPGAVVMAHPRRQMTVGCHRPLAQRGMSCSAVTGASSAALRGGECLSPLHFFHKPSPHHLLCLMTSVSLARLADQCTVLHLLNELVDVILILC